VQIGADRPGLASENQAIAQIVGLEDVLRCHVDLTLNRGRHARTAVAFPARVGASRPASSNMSTKVLTAWPGEPMCLAIQVELDVCDFCHEPMVGDRHRTVLGHVQWPGKRDRVAR